MKILHISTGEHGGAAIAARRLNTALNRHGNVVSLMGVKTKSSDDKDIAPLKCYSSHLMQKIADRCSDRLLSWFKPDGRTVFSAYLFHNDIDSSIAVFQPDIIHLHWIAGNFISPGSLNKIAKLHIPVVWTLHDAWPFTGGCHYFGNCRQWVEACVCCPVLQRRIPYNLAQMQWKSKKRAYKNLCPTVIGLSRFFCHSIKQSSLLRPFHLKHLPNPIDATVFRPLGTGLARQILGLPLERKFILFGACSATSDKRKGYDLLVSALNTLPLQYRNQLSCLVFGASHKGNMPTLPLPVHFLGSLHDEVTLTLAYSAADVFVCPSREENFPNTILESLSCGTPVVGFSIGGIPDMVEHKINGMLAAPYDPHELADGIAYILASDKRCREMGEFARKKVLECYDMPVVASQYVTLYEQLLNKTAGVK